MPLAVNTVEDTTTFKIYYDKYYQYDKKNEEKESGKEEKEHCFYAQICALAVKNIAVL